jgi:acyl-CoA reductase-like NAD-dependent aldehyde dehydrogenase
LNQGASCTAGSRIIVDASLHDELVERIVARAPQYRPMDPLDAVALAGSMVNQAAFDRVCGYLRVGREEGATLTLGGGPAGDGAGGRSVQQTVFTAVQPGMRIAQEEIFGPVLSVIRFEDPEEALAIANGTGYGLNAAVWTRDLDRAHRFARRLRAGMVTINGFGGVNPALPFGGVGLSGSGRDNSLHALDGYTYLKSTRISLG